MGFPGNRCGGLISVSPQVEAFELSRELGVADLLRVAQGERSSRTDSSERAHGAIGIGWNI
jgi:hypothetical protein